MFDAGLHPIFLIITLFRHFPLCTFSVCFYFILVSNTWFICLLYSGYVVEHMNTHRRTNLATLSVYLHSLYLLTFICSVSFIQALAVLFSCTEHEGDEGGAGAMAYNSRQTPWFSMKWTEQISWYEFTQADVWSHDTLVDQMHALFWSPRWPSQQFQHLNLVRRQKILFYFFEGFLNQSTLDFFFSLKWEVFGSQMQEVAMQRGADQSCIVVRKLFCQHGNLVKLEQWLQSKFTHFSLSFPDIRNQARRSQEGGYQLFSITQDFQI